MKEDGEGAGGDVAAPSAKSPARALRALAVEILAAFSSGQLCSRRELDIAVRAALAEARRKESTVTEHDRNLEKLRRFLFVYDPARADRAATILQEFEKAGRVDVLWGMLETRYRRPVDVGAPSLADVPGHGLVVPARRALSSGSPSGAASLRSGSSKSLSSRGRWQVAAFEDSMGTMVQTAHSTDSDNDDVSRAPSTVVVPVSSTHPFLPPPKWVEDDAQSTCMICTHRFSLARRKHHCRSCGRLVCNDCSPASARRCVPEFNHFQPVRLCVHCVILQ